MVKPIGYIVVHIENGIILPCTKKDSVSNTMNINIVARMCGMCRVD